MRSSLPLLVMTAWTLAPVAWPQTAAPQPAVTGQAASEPAATQPAATQPAAAQPAAAHAVAGATGGTRATGVTSGTHASRRSSSRRARSSSAAGAAPGSAPAGKSDGVLALGATDITGNKELPKVMVIVPWKDSMGASGVIPPTDSLMDEALEPVDRGVFQRRIRYYGQLNAAGEGSPASKVAPVGDSK